VATGPLYRWDDLAAWAGSTPAKKGKWDLSLGAVQNRGVEGRGRVAYGLTPRIQATAEAWATWNRTWETGALVGLTGRW
jgi:hypothetical protein